MDERINLSSISDPGVHIWTQPKERGFKRKQNNKSGDMTIKKPRGNSSNEIIFTTPLKESTLIESPNSTETEDIEVDNDKPEENGETEQKTEGTDKEDHSHNMTTDLLRALLKSKDDLLQHKDVEKSYLDIKISNLEKLLVEKDNVNRSLHENLNRLSKDLISKEINTHAKDLRKCSSFLLLI